MTSDSSIRSHCYRSYMGLKIDHAVCIRGKWLAKIEKKHKRASGSAPRCLACFGTRPSPLQSRLPMDGKSIKNKTNNPIKTKRVSSLLVFHKAYNTGEHTTASPAPSRCLPLLCPVCAFFSLFLPADAPPRGGKGCRCRRGIR